jgi:hypothetical protein
MRQMEQPPIAVEEAQSIAEWSRDQEFKFRLGA